MKSRWITHQGKRIFYADYSKMDVAALREEAASVIPILTGEPKNSVLVIADVRDTFGTSEVMEVIKGITAKTKFHVRKRAVIGIFGIKKILLNTVNQFSGQETVAFATEAEALDWLVKD